MGLGFSIWYPVGNNKHTHKEVYEQFFRELPGIVPEWNKNCYFNDSGFRIQLVPFEEELYGSWEEDRLCISARTSNAGPGYHAWLIHLLDGLKIKPLQAEDETGYYKQRDFNALKESMMDWLKGLSRQILEMTREGEYENLAVGMPIDWMPVGSTHLACCLLGYFDNDFFERAEKGKADGSEFFIWWNREQDAIFFKNCALNLIWCNNNWLLPETDKENENIRATLACLEKAYSLDRNLNYPFAEWNELERLLGEMKLTEKLQARFDTNEAVTLGYLHGFITSNEGGWRFIHSGKMHFERDDEGNAVWWNDLLTIRLTIITVQFSDEVENKSEALLQSALRDKGGYEPLFLQNTDIHAAIEHSQYEEDGELLWKTQLFAAWDNELLVLSLYYSDENKKDLAVEICASVTH